MAGPCNIHSGRQKTVMQHLNRWGCSDVIGVHTLQETGVNDAASDSEECLLSFWASIAWLTVLTVFISILSEYLVDAIEVCLQKNLPNVIHLLNIKL